MQAAWDTDFGRAFIDKIWKLEHMLTLVPITSLLPFLSQFCILFKGWALSHNFIVKNILLNVRFINIHVLITSLIIDYFTYILCLTNVI